MRTPLMLPTIILSIPATHKHFAKVILYVTILHMFPMQISYQKQAQNTHFDVITTLDNL